MGQIIPVREYIVPISLTGAAGYQGPGNITTFTNWRGLRAYSSATAAALVAAIDVTDFNGNAPATIHVTADGDLNASEIAAAISGFGANLPGKIVKVYDQVGDDHLTKAFGSASILSTTGSPLGGWAATFSRAGASQIDLASGASNHSQPYCISAVVKRTADFTTTQVACGGDGVVGFGNSNELFIYAGNGITVTAADNAFHVVNGLFNGASSKVMVDGADTSGNAGTATSGASGKWGWGCNINFASQELSGIVMEDGLINGNPGDSVRAALDANQFAYWEL